MPDEGKNNKINNPHNTTVVQSGQEVFRAPRGYDIPWEDSPAPEEKKEVCSYSVCPNGHTWLLSLGLTTCKGCGVQVLGLRMVNCPTCNEPAKGHTLRIDYAISAPHVGIGVCRGAQSPADIIVTELQREENPRFVVPAGSPQVVDLTEVKGQEGAD